MLTDLERQITETRRRMDKLATRRPSLPDWFIFLERGCWFAFGAVITAHIMMRILS